MGDPSSMVTEAVIKEILRHINIACRCRKELESLRSLVSTLQGFNSDLQKNRVAARTNPSVNKWLKELDVLLKKANQMVKDCTIPTCNLFSRYTMSRKIARIIRKIEKHKSDAPFVQLVHLIGQAPKEYKSGCPAQERRKTSKGGKPGSSTNNKRKTSKGDKSGSSTHKRRKSSKGNKSGSSADAKKKDKTYKFMFGFSFAFSG